MFYSKIGNEILEVCVFLRLRTNLLDRYHNKDFTLTLPDNKKITDIKWFAIYDLTTHVSSTQ